LVVAAGLVLTGCGSGPTPSPELTPSPDPASPSATGSAPTTAGPQSPAPTTATAAPTAAPAEPTAADGTDYSACRDGNCEVAISKPVTIDVGTKPPIKVTVAKDRITFERMRSKGNGFSGSFGGRGHCIAYLTPSGFSASCTKEPQKPDPDDGQLALELVDVTDGTAIVRLSKG
jgi:hypothetical protein